MGLPKPPKSKIEDTTGYKTATATATLPLTALIIALAAYYAISPQLMAERWQKMSSAQRRDALNAMEGKNEDELKKDCDDRYAFNIKRCKRASERKGSRAGAVCYESANRIYAECLRGRPDTDWPPLQD